VVDPPGWWTSQDSDERRIAAAGCRTPDADCGDCRYEKCPEAFRLCRICAEWRSDHGFAGVCADTGKDTTSNDTCTHWRMRV
jgi:hypothetical protein